MQGTAVDAYRDEVLAEPEYRVEGIHKVTGRARYTGDIPRPGLLYARFLMSPYPHAKILSIDTSAARALPGVHAVITGKDIGPKRYGKAVYDVPVLAYDRVRYVGERIAGVAAESREIADAAVALIEVEYEELPAVFDAEEALLPDAPLVHPNADEYQWAQKNRETPHPNAQGYGLKQRGEEDIEKVFASAHLVVEDVYEGPRQHQGHIEPHSCTVWIEDDGTLQVRSTNKAPFGLRSQLAQVTGLEPRQINIDSMFIGGDFGGKGHSIEEFACYFLAKETGRPVRSVMTYAEELGSANPQHGAKYYLRSAVDAEGHIIAHESKAYLNGGAYGGTRPSPHGTADGGMECLYVYRVPNTRLESFYVTTNTVPSGNMRAPGDFHRGQAGEMHIDHIARELNMDPIEIRLKNVLREGDTTILGGKVRNPKGVDVLEALKREVDWDRPLPPNHGRGIALRHRHVGQGKSSMLLRLLADGTFEVLTAAPDQGGGVMTVARRVAAAALSVPVERIKIRYGSTGESPFDAGVGGSRATHTVGQATLTGALIMKNKLEELAAEVMGWPAGEVHLDRDRFVVGENGESAPFEEVAAKIVTGEPVEALGSYDAAEQGHHDEGGDYNFYAYMIEVHVDPDTGRIEPVDIVAILDCGTIINPVAHQGQVDGGLIYGWGNTMMEELVFEDGRVTTLSLGEYKLPTQMDVPASFRAVILQTEVGPGPFGSKAAGELTNTGVGGAVANAVYDAVGVRVNTSPITSERVYDALQARGR